MAPERFLGDSGMVTHSADIYALACVFYELLTGSPPYRGDRTGVMGGHLSGPIPRASSHAPIPPALDDVLTQGMAKNPDDRYPSAGELARAAEAAIALGATSPNLSAPPTASAAPTAVLPRTDSVPPTVSTPYGPGGGAAGPPIRPAGIPSVGPPPSQWPQQWGPVPAPTAAARTKRRRRWILVAAAVVLVVAVAGGIGIWRWTSGKSTQAQGIDISKLDVGHYATKPRTLSRPATEQEGRFLEAFRLAEGIANPYDIDPKFDHVYGDAVPDPKLAATSIAGTVTPLVQPVLEKYGMISAYIVQGISTRISEFLRTRNGDVLLIMLTSFPNDDAAARAATEMDATDFAVNPDNQHLTIPGYPQAKAHYRPGYASIAATMARGRLVVSVVTSGTTVSGLSDLRQQVQRTFDAQAPLMDQLIPAAEAGLTLLPLDPDHMLSRSFIAGDQPNISDTYGSVGPRAAALCAGDQELKDGLFGHTGVDRCASTPDGQLLRAGDDGAASALLTKMVQADAAEYMDHEVAPPEGLTTNARCYEEKQEMWSDDANLRFECAVSFGRYVAWVHSNEDKDARQRAAAQYAILVNSA
jgi:hypothetical protein